MPTDTNLTMQESSAMRWPAPPVGRDALDSCKDASAGIGEQVQVAAAPTVRHVLD
ncbi:hypothetical protein [Paeniglutamicibacter gangotriensis]|uniref:hypothetical protein n=1 Tax=Paeniglutamicibacter gangotriensis TaxID=254787 RepID=UPI00165F6C86|nr:hypothetical protein [Paeniglutamicibacter gangotriensis]